MTTNAKAPIDHPLLGRVLTGRLRFHNMSLRSAAPLIGTSFNSIGRAARGEPVDLATYTLVCHWLQLSMDTFMIPTEERES